MNFFVNRGMVHAVPIEIDEKVVEAIGKGLEATYEPERMPERITGRLLTSVPSVVELAPLDDLAQVQYIKMVYTRCGTSEKGKELKTAIENDEPIERIDQLFTELLDELPSNIIARTMTVENQQEQLKQHIDNEFLDMVMERCKGTETAQKIVQAADADEPIEELLAEALADLPGSSDAATETVEVVKAQAFKAGQEKFLENIRAYCLTSEKGNAVVKAIDDKEPMERIQELYVEYIQTKVLTVDDIKKHARDLAEASQKVHIDYIVDRDATGDEQMRSVYMAFAENGLMVDDKQLPVPRSFGMLRMTAYAVADDILHGMPLLNLPMFCPLACVVMTQDMHRIAVNAYSLVREAVYMWVVHAVAFLGMDPDPKNPKKQNIDPYVNQVVCITKFTQPFCDDYTKDVKALGDQWNDETAKAFYIRTVTFTAQIVYVLWKSVSYLLCIPEVIDNTLQASPITSCEALFTERELKQTQEHQDLVMQQRLPEGEDDDPRPVATVFADFFQTGSDADPGPAPRIQDGVDAFMKHYIARNSAAPVVWAELTVGQLKAMWTQVCEAEKNLWEPSYADVLGLI